jgi:hypothetical protein
MTDEEIEKLAAALAIRIKPSVSLHVALWSTETIGEYYNSRRR